MAFFIDPHWLLNSNPWAEHRKFQIPGRGRKSPTFWAIVISRPYLAKLKTTPKEPN